MAASSPLLDHLRRSFREYLRISIPELLDVRFSFHIDHPVTGYKGNKRAKRKVLLDEMEHRDITGYYRAGKFRRMHVPASFEKQGPDVQKFSHLSG
jgi:hypothetical protein